MNTQYIFDECAGLYVEIKHQKWYDNNILYKQVHYIYNIIHGMIMVFMDCCKWLLTGHLAFEYSEWNTIVPNFRDQYLKSIHMPFPKVFYQSGKVYY
jgi:hypothetical protein